MSYIDALHSKKCKAAVLAIAALLSFSEAHAISKNTLKKSLSEINGTNQKPHQYSHTNKKLIKTFTTKGNTLFQHEILNIVNQHKDKEFTEKLEEEIIAKINEVYSNHGYILSFVHYITWHNNVITLDILEGSFRNIVISDEKLLQNKLLKQYIEKLKSSHPFKNTPEMERTFALIKRIPGLNEYSQVLHFKAVPAKDINRQHPQTTDLFIGGDYNEFEGIATINNRFKTNYKKQMRENNQRNLEFEGSGINADITLDYNNPFNRGDKINFNTSYSGKGDLVSVGGGYTAPINTVGTNINVVTFFSHSSTYNGTAGTGGALNITHPIFLTRKHSVDASFGIETYHENYKDFGQQNFKTNITKATLGARYMHKINPKTKYYIGTEVQKSLSSSSNAFSILRNDEIITLKNRQFTKFLFSAGFDFPIKDFVVSAETQAQLSNKTTPVAELMQIGQEKGGRGFRSGEIKGNKAILGSTELSYYGKLQHHFFLGYKAYGFIDIGHAKNDVFKTSATLASTGIGSDVFLRDNIVLTIELTKPLIIDKKYNQRPIDRSTKNLKVFGEIAYFFNF